MTAFKFWASTPLDNIILNVTNMKADKWPSAFQSSISTVAHATLETEQLISHIRTANVDTVTSLQILMQRLSQFHKYITYLTSFMTLWKRLLVIWLTLQSFCL